MRVISKKVNSLIFIKQINYLVATMHRNFHGVINSMKLLRLPRINHYNQRILALNSISANFVRTKKDDTSLFKPVPIKLSQDDINVGAELTGMSLDKAELLKILGKFSQKNEVRVLCFENGMDRELKIKNAGFMQPISSII